MGKKKRRVFIRTTKNAARVARPKHPLGPAVNEYLRNVHISFQFAHDVDHGVSYQKRNWKLFEPTRFVYAFFTFNMLYDIDWNLSLRRRRLWDKRSIPLNTERIKGLLDFLYSTDPDRTTRLFISSYRRFDTLNAGAEMVLAGIVRDRNITARDQSDFLTTPYQSYLDGFYSAFDVLLNSDRFGLLDHYRLLAYVYRVRNNLFHGHKKASSLIEQGQRERLRIYANIVLATTDTFFDVMSADYGFIRPGDEDLREEAQLDVYAGE